MSGSLKRPLSRSYSAASGRSERLRGSCSEASGGRGGGERAAAADGVAKPIKTSPPQTCTCICRLAL